jgi:predicted permease
MTNRPATRAHSIRFSTLDFKLGARMLARYPGLTIVGTAAIAVAIALGTVFFEAVNKFKNPRLPMRDAERVISIRTWDVNAFREEFRSLHDFATWRGQLKTVDHLGAAVTFVRNLATEDGRVEPVRGAEISANAFRILGKAPIKGRSLTEQDERPAEPPVVVISQALWKTRFDSDPNVLGRVVKLGTVAMTIVGVMPEGFGFPVNHRIWTPLRVDASTLPPRTGPEVSIFGRLAPNASIDDARAELAVVSARISASFPETHKNLRPRVTIYEEPFGYGAEWRWFNGLLDVVKGVLLMLLGVVSVNVATLVFARTATRGWEIAVRTALGASRGRIISQLFIEALMLTGLAAIVGLIVAKVVLRFGLQLMAAGDAFPYWVEDSLSGTTVLYTTLLMFFGAAIVGILPALRVTRINVQDALRSESAARSGLRFGGLWTTVIVVQVAITVAFLPLAANGMFAANRFQQRADGIGADRYLAARIDMDREDYRVDSATFAARARARVDELERRLLTEPGVERIAFADRLPVEDQFKYGIEVDTTTGLPATGIRGSTLVDVSRGFFGAFGTSVISGRDFAPSDFDNGHVLIVNQSFVRYVLGGRNAIGQRIRIGSGEDERAASNEWYEIVGMVKDFGWQLPEPEQQSAMYRPSIPIVGRAGQIAVRVRDPEAFAARLRTIVADVDPTIRLSDLQPLGQVGGGEVRRIRMLTAVAWVISFVILVLSATGIHALMAFTVARRTREIGIRAALGASTGHIVRGIFSRAFMQISIGLLVGSGLAALVGLGSMRQLLLLLAADGVMLVVGLTACALPLRRALRIDPTEALRAEG